LTFVSEYTIFVENLLNMDEKFKIDFFELSFLVEACIPPVPIARNYFWKKMIDTYYDQLSNSERSRIHEWMNRMDRYKRGLEEKDKDVLLFEARYNPDNQFTVHTYFHGKKEEIDCFLFDGEFMTNSRTFIQEEFITKTEKKNS
jgi:hypothetical protein